MSFNSSAIRAYFDEADYGNNHWAAWAAGLWVIMVTVMAAQVIVGIPMVIGMMSLPRDILEGLEAPSSTAPYQMEAGIAFAIGTLLALISYVVRDNYGKEKEKTVLSIGGIFALISTVGFFYLMRANSGPESSAYVNAMLGNSKLIYASMLAIFPIHRSRDRTQHDGICL